MQVPDNIKTSLANCGYAIVNGIYSDAEIKDILGIIARADNSKATFRKTEDIFAIRQFLKEIPESAKVIFNQPLLDTIGSVFGEGYFVSKAIYFDKPEKSNWFVPYHQDLTISVNRKLEMEGFGPWTTKHNQFAVQPPLNILENNFTIRIHLDETTSDNGALRVISGSHRKGVCRPDSINRDSEKEFICEVEKGGIMLMKPLLLHSSGRTTNNRKRRVLHIEFSKEILPSGLEWAELLSLKPITREFS